MHCNNADVLPRILYLHKQLIHLCCTASVIFDISINKTLFWNMHCSYICKMIKLT